jgi:GNAT superfamily N-acetyltransferase
MSDDQVGIVGNAEARPVLAPVGTAIWRCSSGWSAPITPKAGWPSTSAGNALHSHSWSGATRSGAADWSVSTAGSSANVVLTWSFSLESGLDGYIDELFLEPEVRGRGIGTRVLAQAVLEARRRGCLRLYLEVEHGGPAINLYRRAGFVDHRRHLM